MKNLTKNQRLYQCPIPIIALTGGIATGKSTVGKMLQDQGLTVLSADALVKEIYQDKKIIDEVHKLAPQAIENNQINFPKLRELFFSNKELSTKIETLVLAQLPQKFTDNLPKNIDKVVLEIPLLFEKNLQDSVDFIITSYCSDEVQLKRIQERDGSSLETAKQIIAKQLPQKVKIEGADVVIDTEQSSGEIEHYLTQILTSSIQNK